MLKFMKVSLLAAAVVTTTAATPFVLAQPLMTFMPLAIIEGGTVSTLPKGAKSHAGKVVVLRGRGDRVKAAPAKTTPARATPARATPASAARAKVRSAAPATAPVAAPASTVASAKSCQCATGGVSGDGRSGEIVELRNPEVGLRVMILGPDGLTSTRYVPAPPGSSARNSQE